MGRYHRLTREGSVVSFSTNSCEIEGKCTRKPVRDQEAGFTGNWQGCNQDGPNNRRQVAQHCSPGFGIFTTCGERHAEVNRNHCPRGFKTTSSTSGYGVELLRTLNQTIRGPEKPHLEIGVPKQVQDALSLADELQAWVSKYP